MSVVIVPIIRSETPIKSQAHFPVIADGENKYNGPIKNLNLNLCVLIDFKKIKIVGNKRQAMNFDTLKARNSVEYRPKPRSGVTDQC